MANSIKALDSDVDVSVLFMKLRFKESHLTKKEANARCSSKALAISSGVERWKPCGRRDVLLRRKVVWKMGSHGEGDM